MGPSEVFASAELRNMFNLEGPATCHLPCWGGLKPGSSDVQEVSSFFARLGVGLTDLVFGDEPRAAEEPLRYAALTFDEHWETGKVAESLGLDGVVAFWSPQSGTLRAIRISYWKTPSQMDAPSLFAKLGQPDSVLMTQLENGYYRTVLIFSSTRAILRTDVSPRRWPYICLTAAELDPPELVFTGSSNPPADFLPMLVEFPSDMVGPEDFARLPLPEFISAISRPGGCVRLAPNR